MNFSLPGSLYERVSELRAQVPADGRQILRPLEGEHSATNCTPLGCQTAADRLQDWVYAGGVVLKRIRGAMGMALANLSFPGTRDDRAGHRQVDRP